MSFPQFRSMCASWWAGIFFQSRISRPGEGGNTTDTVRVTEATANSPEQVIEPTRLEQYGDVVCPPKDCNAIILTKGDGGVVVPLGVPSVRPTDEKPGDRGLYNDAGARVHLYGSQQGTKAGDVVVNDGTHEVARVGDTGNAGSLSMTVLPVSPPAPPGTQLISLIYTDPVDGSLNIIGSLTFSPAGTLVSVQVSFTPVKLRNVNNSGAPHFKA